jgi:predicted HD phosphohydrolase
VANAGYAVAEHSLQAARRLEFRAMQFNLVVSTLPGAFGHRQLGYVDALVMIQGLVEGPNP